MGPRFREDDITKIAFSSPPGLPGGLAH